MTWEEYCVFRESLVKIVTSGYEVMLFHQGLGETCTFLQLLDEYYAKTKRKFVMLAVNDGRVELLSSSPYVHDAIKIPIALYNSLYKDIEFRVHYGIKDFLQLYNIDWLKKEGQSLKNKICRFMGLDETAKLVRYNLFSEEEQLEVRRKLYECNIDICNSVLIVPHALCYGDNVVPQDFWEKLIKEIKRQLSYEVLINSNTLEIDGASNIFLSIKDSAILASLCAGVIGVRTGFLDVVAAFTDVEIQAIYPSDDNEIWTTNEGLASYKGVEGKSLKQMQTLSLNHMYQGANAYEYVYTNEEELLETIVARLIQAKTT